MGDQIRVYFIPADTDKPMEVKMINRGWLAMSELIGGGYIEVVRTPEMPKMKGSPMVMVVDEEGLLKRLEHNPRASIYYPGFDGIKGDAFLVAENGPDFTSLPEAIVDWDGPGSKLPAGC